MRTFLCTVIGLSVFCAGLYLFEVKTHDALLARSGGDMRQLASELVVSDIRSDRCLSERREKAPFDDLMRAIRIAEQYGTTQFERVFEAALVRGFDLIGRQPPDYSLGPGQIRASTVIKALSAQRRADGMSQRLVAERLLDDCWNHRFGVAVIGWIASAHGIGEAELAKREIRTIARSFNGGRSTTSVEGWVASEAYVELVYHLYNDLRFRRFAKR